jgi:iron-sulfur cluster assembly protein
LLPLRADDLATEADETDEPRDRLGLILPGRPCTVDVQRRDQRRRQQLVLTLTENASTVVKTLVDQQEDAGGLRISQDAPDSPALHVIPSPTPQPGDQVVEQSGARVFLEETAAFTLDDKVLDAQVDDGGGVQFSIGQQA